MSDNLTIDQKIGAIIRKRRQQLGLSQEAIAKSIGITFQQVQKYERGTNALNSSRFVQMSQALAVPVAFFFAWTEGVAAETNASNRESLELMKAFNNIPTKEVRKRISDLVRSVGGA